MLNILLKNAFDRQLKIFDMTDEQFCQAWDKKIQFADEKNYQRKFKVGFNLWTKDDNSPAKRVLTSWHPDSPHIIISENQKKQGYITIFENIELVLIDTYVQPYSCKITEGCIYSCKNKWKLGRHEKSCTAETRMSYKQKMYGNQTTIRSELINIGVINPSDKSHQRFISFDIESVNQKQEHNINCKTIITGLQRVISIGYLSSFGNFKNVMFRNDMTNEAGLELVQRFLDKMHDIQVHHYEQIPEKVKETMIQYKQLMKNKDISVRSRTMYARRMNYLRSLCKLKIIGFNSSGYDLLCILNLIIQVAGP